MASEIANVLFYHTRSITSVVLSDVLMLALFLGCS